MSFLDNLKRSAARHGAPVTIGLMVALGVAALLLFLAKFQGSEPFMFSAAWISKPWSLLTYPFCMPWLVDGNKMVELVFTLYWLYWVGSSTESEIGSARFGIVCAAFTLLPALFMWLGMLLLRVDVPLYSPLLPISGLTVAWGFRNSSAIIRLFAIIPITGFWLALLSVGICFFDYATPIPLLGAFACLHLALAWAFSQNKLAFFPYSRPVVRYKPSKAQQKKDSQFLEDVRKREQERQEREKLRKLFEDSMIDEDAS